MRGALPLCTPQVGASGPCAHLFGRSAPIPGLLSRVEESSSINAAKDTPGTSWFGVRRTPDLRRRGTSAPFDPPALCPSGIGCDSLNPQASSVATLPCHGLKTQNVSFDETKGKNKTDLPTNSKWQIGLFLWLKPYRGGAACRRGSGSEK